MEKIKKNKSKPKSKKNADRVQIWVKKETLAYEKELKKLQG